MQTKARERFQVMLAREELAAIDNFRFERRMPSRAWAVRELLRRGLAVDGFGFPSRGKIPTAGREVTIQEDVC